MNSMPLGADPSGAIPFTLGQLNAVSESGIVEVFIRNDQIGGNINPRKFDETRDTLRSVLTAKEQTLARQALQKEIIRIDGEIAGWRHIASFARTSPSMDPEGPIDPILTLCRHRMAAAQLLELLSRAEHEDSPE